MAGAFAGLADDVESVWHNPGGLSQVVVREIGVEHGIVFGLATVDSVMFSQPLLGGVVGVVAHYVDYGTLETYSLDSFGNPIPDERKVHPFAVLGAAAWSVRLNRNWSVGATGKLLHEDFAVAAQQSAVGDLGILWRTGLENLRLGLVLENLPLLAYRLPVGFRAGGAYTIAGGLSAEDELRIVAEAVLPGDQELGARAGLEYWYRGIIALRAGYAWEDAARYNALNGLSAGLGFRVGPLEGSYAFTPNSELGMTHRISLIFRMATETAKKALREGRSQGQSGRYLYEYLFPREQVQP
jgi:hypothetical protein